MAPQLDLRPVTSTAARHLEDSAGEISDAALAGYIAKYATKSTGAVDSGEGPDRPIRDGDHIAHLDVSPHHRRMIDTAWQLGDLPQYEALNLRRWAHMLGFRGHFLTKSRAYSTTFTAIRHERRTWRLRDELDRLAADTDNQATAHQVHRTLCTALNEAVRRGYLVLSRRSSRTQSTRSGYC